MIYNIKMTFSWPSYLIMRKLTLGKTMFILKRNLWFVCQLNQWPLLLQYPYLPLPFHDALLQCCSAYHIPGSYMPYVFLAFPWFWYLMGQDEGRLHMCYSYDIISIPMFPGLLIFAWKGYNQTLRSLLVVASANWTQQKITSNKCVLLIAYVISPHYMLRNGLGLKWFPTYYWLNYLLKCVLKTNHIFQCRVAIYCSLQWWRS